MEFEGVGTMRSPLLEELRPMSCGGIGEKTYMMYLTLLSWEKEDAIEYSKLSGIRGWDKVDNEQFGMYEVVMVLRPLRDMFLNMLSFFIIETVEFDETHMRFITSRKTEDEGYVEVGLIDSSNFEDVRDAILNLNYVGIDKKDVEAKFTSVRAKEAWEKVQKFLKAQQKANVKRDNGKYHLANLISKLCVSGNQYSIFNVYKLTIFQFYDQVFQYSSLRRASLDENIFSNHGGDRFKADGWLNPLNEKV